LLTCQRFFEVWPKPYFWTFTFRDVMPDDWYPQHWHRFIVHLNNLHGGHIMGVRVVELHEEHGLHYHAILNMRISIHLVNRIARKYGIGRVGVEECNFGAAEYLVPYLNPRDGAKITKGMRQWGTIGGFKGTKTCDIEIDSPFHRNMRLLNSGGKVGFKICNEVFRFSAKYGDFHEWPVAVRDYGRALARYSDQSQNRAMVLFFQRKLDDRDLRMANTLVVAKTGCRTYFLDYSKRYTHGLKDESFDSDAKFLAKHPYPCHTMRSQSENSQAPGGSYAA